MPRVSNGEMTSVAAAKALLIARLGHGVADVSPIAHGAWSQAFAFRHGGGDYILRFSALDEDFQKDRLAARFATPALPLPAITEIGETGDGFYAISERAAGGFLDDLDGAQMRDLLPSLFAALDAMREADLSASSGYGIWGADGNAPHTSWRETLLDIAHDRPGERTHGWRERLAASPTGSGPFAEAFDLLRTLTDCCPEERYLIHSDLLHFNVLVEERRISAVIDWGCAMDGDFLYDLAWFLFWAPWYPAWRGIDFREEAARHDAAIGLDIPNCAKRLTACQIHIGLAGQAYNAFTERWDDLEETAARTLEVARPD